MSVKALAHQFTIVFNEFLANKIEESVEKSPTINDYDGPNTGEVISYIEFLRETYQPIINNEEVHLLSKAGITQLINSIGQANQTFHQFNNAKQQSNFQAFANSLDQLVYQTRTLGAPYLAIGEATMAARSLELNTELATLKEKNVEIDNLRTEVKNLITPAIAGSLSNEFQTRRNNVFYGRIGWLVFCIVLGITATYATYDFVHTISSALVLPNVFIASSTQASTLNIWAVIAIRTIVLIPLFAAFGFSFSQYRKERDFEEEYAHKAAVAHSLPNYGDLAKDKTVRDAIVTAATTVIFSSPSEQARKAETSNAMVSGFREIVDAMGKAISKK